MITWYQILSFFFTNWLRIFLGLCLIAMLLQLSENIRKASVFSVCATVFITMFSCFPVRQFYLIGAQIIILAFTAWCLFIIKPRICLFLAFFYEITVAFWEFIISAGLSIVFKSENFLNIKSFEYIITVWIVRLLMLGIAFTVIKTQKDQNKQLSRILTRIGITGLFGIVFLSGQNSIVIDDDQMTTWIIFSILILVAILLFYFNRQYELEKKISQLEKEKNALLEHDYQTLKSTYAANAKLFHDFHNHIDVLYHYLLKNNTAEAVKYLKNLRSPMQIITQTAWIGDEAVDYLINNKIALAVSQNIQVHTNIEFPRHTNIRSVDLVVILGNLLDNCLEATKKTEDSLRFINLTIRRINDMLIIKVENGCNIAPIIDDKDLQTSKTDKTLHGWGLKNVRTTAERYDGTVETKYNNHIFYAVVTLSFKAVAAQ